MVSARKRAYFLPAGLISIGTIVMIGISLGSSDWVYVKVVYHLNISNNNTYYDSKCNYGLFSGKRTINRGLGVTSESIPVNDRLFKNDGVKGTSQAAYAFLLLFVFVAELFAVIKCLFAFYNGLTNPYHSIQGPWGLYIWNSVCGACCLLGLVIFPLAAQTSGMTGALLALSEEESITGYEYGTPYWLVLGAMFSCAVPIAITYAYNNINLKDRQAATKATSPATNTEVLMY